MRSTKDTAMTFEMGFHLIVHRCCPVPFGSSERTARNTALDLLGEIDQSTREPLEGRLAAATSTFGKRIGFKTRVNGIPKSLRMDFDPVKGSHINVAVGKGTSGQKWAVQWPGTLEEFTALLKGNA